MNRFVYSDPHFGSAMQRVPGNEKFDGWTAEERDEHIIDNWNRVVNKRDQVYLLGDIGWKNEGYIIHGVLARLKGEIRVVGGNHDTPAILQHAAHTNGAGIKQVNGVITMRVNGYDCILTHVPIHPQEMWWDYNIHGHLHHGTIKKHATHPDHRFTGPNDPRYICVCGEHLAFTPRPVELVVPEKGKGTHQEVTRFN